MIKPQQGYIPLINPQTGQPYVEKKKIHFDNGPEHIILFDDEDITSINKLDNDIKKKIIKLSHRREIKKILGDVFKCTVDNNQSLIDGAIEELVRGEITLEQIGILTLQIQKGQSINVNKLKHSGNVDIRDVFTEEAYRAFLDLRRYGVGANQAGPGELALALLSPNINIHTKGDIEIDGKLVELKLDNGRIGPDYGLPRMDQQQKRLNAHMIQKGFDLSHLTRGSVSVNFKKFYDVLYNLRNIKPELAWNCAFDMIKNILDDYHASIVAHASLKSKDIFINTYIKELFDFYKKSKKGSDGEWDTLIGINTTSKNGSIGIAKNGSEFIKLKKAQATPCIIPSCASALRDYLFSFSPVT